MFLKQIGKLISLLLLYYLLAWYSIALLGTEAFDTFLIKVWKSTFTKFDAQCIHWIALRLGIWVYVFLIMMRLENRFTVYLFIRQRKYITLFTKMYTKCLLAVGLYYGLAMVVMTALFAVMIPNGSFFEVMGNETIIGIMVWECLDCLNICLVAYLLYCYTKQMEISFMLSLVARFMLVCFMKGQHPGIMVELCINLFLAVGVLKYASHNFMERIREY